MRKYYPERDLTQRIISAAIEVHNYWGPGLYEEIYERSLFEELRMKGIAVERQAHLPLIYKGIKIGDDLRLDLYVDQRVIVEIKCVKALADIHTAQLLTYLKLTHCKVGLLLNFNANTIKEGLKRVVN